VKRIPRYASLRHLTFHYHLALQYHLPAALPFPARALLCALCFWGSLTLVNRSAPALSIPLHLHLHLHLSSSPTRVTRLVVNSSTNLESSPIQPQLLLYYFNQEALPSLQTGIESSHFYSFALTFIHLGLLVHFVWPQSLPSNYSTCFV
jgi:hypothetical protein